MNTVPTNERELGTTQKSESGKEWRAPVFTACTITICAAFLLLACGAYAADSLLPGKRPVYDHLRFYLAISALFGFISTAVVSRIWMTSDRRGLQGLAFLKAAVLVAVGVSMEIGAYVFIEYCRRP